MQVNFIPKVWFDIKVIYKDKIEEERTGEAHSWVRNEWNVMTSLMCFRRLYNTTFGSGLLSLKATDGSIQQGNLALITASSGEPGDSFERTIGYSAAAGNTGRGILVGSSASSEDFDGFKLVSLISHGTTSGRLKYGACRNPTVSWDAVSKEWLVIWTRDCDNVSGGTVIISEIGLIFYTEILGVKAFLVDRSVIVPAIAVPNARLLKVSYRLYFQLPE